VLNGFWMLLVGWRCCDGLHGELCGTAGRQEGQAKVSLHESGVWNAEVRWTRTLVALMDTASGVDCLHGAPGFVTCHLRLIISS
jgi:hypothetical protein